MSGVDREGLKVGGWLVVVVVVVMVVGGGTDGGSVGVVSRSQDVQCPRGPPAVPILPHYARMVAARLLWIKPDGPSMILEPSQMDGMSE